jgi:transposase
MHIEGFAVNAGAEHERDANAAINLRRSGLAEAERTYGGMVPTGLLACIAWKHGKHRG